MEIFRTEVRHIVLTLKSNEEKQKKCKEMLTSVFRTIQNDPIVNTITKGYSTSYIRQILSQLKETDEQNKSIRKCLRVTLIKISEQKKKNEIPILEDRKLPSGNPFPNFQQVQHAEESHTEIRKIHGDTKLIQKSSVTLNNFLLKFEKFIGEVGTIYMATLSCKLPEWKKIKCKIKR